MRHHQEFVQGLRRSRWPVGDRMEVGSGRHEARRQRLVRSNDVTRRADQQCQVSPALNVLVGCWRRLLLRRRRTATRCSGRYGCWMIGAIFGRLSERLGLFSAIHCLLSSRSGLGCGGDGAFGSRADLRNLLTEVLDVLLAEACFYADSTDRNDDNSPRKSQYSARYGHTTPPARSHARRSIGFTRTEDCRRPCTTKIFYDGTGHRGLDPGQCHALPTGDGCVMIALLRRDLRACPPHS